MMRLYCAGKPRRHCGMQQRSSIARRSVQRFSVCEPNVSCHLEIGTQFPDSENAQHYLEIALIPKLRGTYICNLGGKGCNLQPLLGLGRQQNGMWG